MPGGVIFIRCFFSARSVVYLYRSHLVSAMLHHNEDVPEARAEQQPGLRVVPVWGRHDRYTRGGLGITQTIQDS